MPSGRIDAAERPSFVKEMDLKIIHGIDKAFSNMASGPQRRPIPVSGKLFNMLAGVDMVHVP